MSTHRQLQDHDFQKLISELRDSKLDKAADELISEVGKEWASSGSTIVRRARHLRAQMELAQAVTALREGRIARVKGYKLELAQHVADVLEGRHVEMVVPRDSVEALLRSGQWIVLGFERGKFQAGVGEEEAEAGTWQEALTLLADKLSQTSNSEHPSGGEYFYRKT